MNNIGGAILKLVISALVLMVVSYLVPSFGVLSFWTALVAAVVITLLGSLAQAIFGKEISPYARGFIGFLVSAIVIYVTGMIVSGFNVTLVGALIASFVIGIVDMAIPTSLR